MEVTNRDPKAPHYFKQVHEVSEQEPSLVVSTEKVIIGPFERKLVRAEVITQQPNEYRFGNLMIRPGGVHNRSPFVSEDTLTSVGDDGTVSLAVRNHTSREKMSFQTKTVLCKAELTTFVFRPIAVDQTNEASVLFVKQFDNIGAVDLSDTISGFSSFAQNCFLPLKCLRKDYQKMKNVRKPTHNC